MSTVKVCGTCKQSKPLDAFCKDKRSKDGRFYKCRACKREYIAAYQQRPDVRERRRVAAKELKRVLRSTEEGRAKNAAIVKAWRERNPEIARQRRNNANLKRKAQKKGNDSRRVTTAEISRLLSQPCVNCESREHIHIDHIIPLSRGGRHAIGNLQPLCSFCNLSKNNSLQIEWRVRQLQVAEASHDGR
jgi:5-methylcytosine-specific restriction endonuclease McrA